MMASASGNTDAPRRSKSPPWTRSPLPSNAVPRCTLAQAWSAFAPFFKAENNAAEHRAGAAIGSAWRGRTNPAKIKVFRQLLTALNANKNLRAGQFGWPGVGANNTIPDDTLDVGICPIGTEADFTAGEAVV